MDILDKGGQPSHITSVQRKEILRLLAQGEMTIKEIADRYNTYEKKITRVRETALTYSSAMRASLSEEIQDYLRDWALEHRPKIAGSLLKNQLTPSVNSDAHMDDLAACAKELVKRLKDYNAEWEGTLRICDILVDQDDFDGVEFFNKKITKCLLTHLASAKSSFPELKGMHNWEEFRVGDSDEHFLNLISLKAALRDFDGKCDLCPKENKETNG